MHEFGHALGLDHTTVVGSVLEDGYKGGRQVLGPDDIAGIQALYGGPEDVHFSVQTGAEGLETTCLTCIGTNDVYTVGTATGGAGLGTEAEIFKSTMGGENFIDIDAAQGIGSGPHAKGSSPAPGPPGSLGLGPGDNIVAISNGFNGTGGLDAVLQFSVDPAAIGVPGTDVDYSANLSVAAAFAGALPGNPGGGDPGSEAAGDIYSSTVLPFSAFGAYPGIPTPIVAYPGSNRLFADELVLGLQAPASNGSDGVGPAEDDLDALEMDDLPATYFSVALGSPITLTGLLDSHLPDSGPVPAFYPGGPGPPHMAGETITADDILLGGSPGIWAPGHLIGLVPGDDIDALVVSDVTCPDQFSPIGCGLPPDGFLTPGADMALFSLAPGSPSLGLGGFSPADVFITGFGSSFFLYATALDLGLSPSDNLNALDIRIGILPPPLGNSIGDIPEPSTFVLFLMGLLVLRPFIRRKRK